LIQRIRSEFLLTEEDLANETGTTKTEIRKYILEPEIPDYYKEKAIEKGYGGSLMNKIYNDEYFSNEDKEILYSLAVKEKPRLTQEKFSSLKRYISKGYYLTPNQIELTEQIIKIIQPKDFIETIYWNHISQQYYHILMILMMAPNIPYNRFPND
jgi:predicted transcriptional regulator